ncbi:MAG: hypothetical protein WCJ64_04570 [Rhodospirillaceae bacterium]
MNRHNRRAAGRHRPNPTGLGFASVATVVLSNEGLTAAEAMAPGRVAVVLPVPAGNVAATFNDPRLAGYLDGGAAVVLRFERLCDAVQFQRLRDAACTGSLPPAPTHAAPLGVQ